MRKQKLVGVHNILWSHYTGIVLSELHTLMKEHQVDLEVLHVAERMQERKGMGEIDERYHQYRYRVLHQGAIEEVGAFRQIVAGINCLLTSKASKIMVFGYDLPIYRLLILLAPVMRKELYILADATAFDRKRHPLKEKIKAWMLNRARKVLCYGQSHKNYLMSLGVPERKIAIRIQATHNPELREMYLQYCNSRVVDASTAKYFVYVGRLAPEKNLFNLLKAFGQLKTDWTLRLVGGGEQQAALQQYCEQQNLQNVIFDGPLPLRAAMHILAGAQVLVLPSTSEPWGLVVNEAMLCEKPVIVSSHCGCAYELVQEGQNGFVVNPEDVSALTQAMAKFTTGQANIAEMGKQSLKIINNFTPEKAALQIFEALYKN